MQTLQVELGDRSYPVYVGADILPRAHELIGELPHAEKVALFVDEALLQVATDDGPLASIRRGLEPLALDVVTLTARGEHSKSVEVAGRLWRELAAAGVHRSDVAVALGGGVIGDLAGFVTGTFHRGIPWVQVPTTLLAMVDSSIGGKTAIDLPEGKNLVGAFHQPRAVIADVRALVPLPDHQLLTGAAEAVKHGLIADRALLERTVARSGEILKRDPDVLVPFVAEAAAVKVAIVNSDETEQDVRAFLNYGHTLAHALESLAGYDGYSHGEAVAIGMMFIAHLARELGFADRVAEHREALEAFGLPTAGARFELDDVLGAMRSDKKYRGGLRFVVLRDIGDPVVVGDVDAAAIRTAYEAVR